LGSELEDRRNQANRARFNLYIANHASREGIEDYISILRSVLGRRDLAFAVNNHLSPESINIVIDEFANFVTNSEIAVFKERYPAAPLIFLLTEFIEQRWLVRSLNFFDGVADAAVVATLAVYLRRRRRDFWPPSLRDCLVAGIYVPAVPAFCIWQWLNRLRGGPTVRARLRTLGYMQRRYLGLERMIPYADGVVVSHPAIASQLARVQYSGPVLGSLYPEVDPAILQSFPGTRKLGIEITGSMTPYREKWIRRINSSIRALGVSGVFGLCKSRSFEMAAAESSTRVAYSLHPPQNARWKYVSPTRIYRALMRDHTIPVLTRVFGQHPIEQLCLQYEGDSTLALMYDYYKRPSALRASLGAAFAEYGSLAREANDRLVEAMLSSSMGRYQPGIAARRELPRRIVMTRLGGTIAGQPRHGELSCRCNGGAKM
jgi:hypothetical protein